MVAAMKNFLRPRDLAAAIGVSESSLKRWADDGFLRAGRTAGGHRRIPVAEAVRFIRETRVPVVRPELLGFRDVGQLSAAAGADSAGRLYDAFVADDQASARGLIVSWFLAGMGIAALCDGPIRLAFERLGELWMQGPAGIVLEHRAVETAVQVLSGLRAAIPVARAGAPVAMGGAVGGDPYVLPSLAASLVLAEAGLAAVNLGPDVPAAALLAAVDRYRPLLVWRTMSAEVEPAAMREELSGIGDRAAACDGHVAVGGRTSEPVAPLRHERVQLLGSMAELGAFARGLLASRPAGPAGSGDDAGGGGSP
jgi:methanogenic corrinoid protein MtbC1